MRHKPINNYSGLTVVMSNPARNDEKMLLTGSSGYFFNYQCLAPYTNRMMCDIRTSDTIGEGLLPYTRGILLLGERAFKEWTVGYEDYSLGEQRGCPLVNRIDPSITTVASYLPIDCLDLVNWEAKFNAASVYEDDDDEGGDEYETTKKKGKTARRNYGFWLVRDTKKLLAKMYPDKANGMERIVLHNTSKDNFNIYPNSGEIIDVLSKAKDGDFYIDIENDSLRQLLCIGVAHNDSPVYVIPITRYNYQPAYQCLGRILACVALAMNRNTTVIHNTQYDLIVLGWKYSIPFGRNIYDTMLAQHKLFPDTEKSLGHCITAWTWEEYHKDEGVFQPQNAEQEMRLWKYNGKDVARMRDIHKAQRSYAKLMPGLEDSINLTNSCCYPYALNTLTGIHYDKDAMMKMVASNDALCEQYIRLLHIALGKDLVSDIRGQSKAGVLSSNQQCVRYFHEMLEYDVVKPSKQTGNPSLDADAMYKLKLKYPENPIIDIVLKLRERLKETSSLKFTPWKE
jgi:hypothetical protein